MDQNQASADELVLVYVPVPDETVAEVLGRSLVSSRLAACVNVIGPLRSFYEWQGKLEDQVEWALLIKTRTGCVEEMMEEIAAKHPYECPAIDVIRVSRAPEPFRDWVLTQTRPEAG